jgi:hypothetical protein
VLGLCGTPDAFRAQAIGPDAIWISRNNPAFLPHTFTAPNSRKLSWTTWS